MKQKLPKVGTKARAVRDFITKKRAAGATFGEIQRFIVEMNGLNYDEMETVEVWTYNTGNVVTKPRQMRKYRGYWCVNLLGGGYFGTYGPGFLGKYCVKIGKKYYNKTSVYALRCLNQIMEDTELAVSRL
jgi:hypothetical protein